MKILNNTFTRGGMNSNFWEDFIVIS